MPGRPRLPSPTPLARLTSQGRLTPLGRLLVAALAAILPAACSVEARPVFVPPSPIATRSPATTGPVKVPETGALFGAWVKPDSYSQPGRYDAIARFEEQLGRPLDIVNTYRRLHEPVGTESDLAFVKDGKTLMISWAGSSTEDILTGAIDDEIRAHARQIKELRKPVLLRLRWEMDRPNLSASVGSPESYQDSWRYVRRIFAEEKARNVSWVFCPTAEGFAAGRAGDFYSGDDEVDWTCVDVYAGTRLAPMSELLAPFLHWAGQRPKPMMIGEYGISRAWSAEERAQWLTEAAAVFRANPQIKAVLYFESDPEERTEHGTFSLSDDPPALEAFTQTARDPWFNTR